MTEIKTKRQTIIASVIGAALLLLGTSSSASTVDLNLNGGANLNINNANNNKMTTPLQSFVPVSPPPGQIDMLPVATPPVTSTVTSFYGSLVNMDIVDPDYPNAVAAKAIRRSTGIYVGKLPDTIPDDQSIKADDVQKFLNDYHKYLKDEQIDSASEPSVINESLPVLHHIKKSSLLRSEQKSSVELLAGQNKLSSHASLEQLGGKTQSSH
jgi:hypothetical protein